MKIGNSKNTLLDFKNSPKIVLEPMGKMKIPNYLKALNFHNSQQLIAFGQPIPDP